MSQKRGLRTFYTLIATQTFSLIGSQMTSLAIGIWVYNETGNASPLAMAAFFAAVPRLVASSVAGVLADRWDRRHVMVIADAGQAVGTALLMFSFVSGEFQLWHLYAVSAWQAAFGMFQGPAFQASVTILIPDEHRTRANALLQLRGPAAGILAPAMAGLLFALVDAAGVMIIDLITFVVAIVVVWLVHIPRPVQTAEGRAAQGTVWQEALVGIKYLWSRRPLFVLLTSATLVNFFFGGVGVLFTPYILSTTGSETLLGTLMSVFSAGAIAGGIIIGVWGGTRRRVDMILPGIAVAGAFFALFGFSRAPALMALMLAGLTLPIPMVNASFDAILQAKTPPDLQGRVFSAVSQVAMFFSPIAFLLAGPLADHVFEPAVSGPHWHLVEPLVGSSTGAGISLMFIISGSAIVVTALAFYALPWVRRLETELPDYVVETDDETAASTVVGDVAGLADRADLAPSPNAAAAAL
jgi:DHA3 family macrolide efflux protein-like MFS transporter